MIQTAFSWLAAMSVVLISASAGAGEFSYDDSAGLVLTETDAVAAALEASQELSRLQERVRARQAGSDYARFDVRNPEIRIQDLSTKYSNPDANHRFQLGMRWRIPRYGEVDENVAQARWEYEEARVDAFSYRMKLVLEVRRACHDVSALKDELALAERREKVEARRFDVVSRMLELGSVPFIRKMKSQTALLRARRDVAAKRNALSAARARLASLVGNEHPVDVTMPRIPEAGLDLSQALRTAEAVRPEIGYEDSRLQMVRMERRAERLKMIPSFSFIEAVYHYERLDPDWGELMLGIEIPIFNWSRGGLRRAEIAAERHETSVKAGSEEIRKEIGQAYRAAAEARAGYLVLKEQTDESREGVMKMVALARQQGIPEDEVLELELSDIDLEEMLLSARRDYVEALIELCVAVGVDGWEGVFAD